MPRITGNRFFAETLKGYGLSSIFWMPAILKPGLMEIERVGGIKRVLCHSEKSAVYMADGYARAGRRPAIVMSQSVGAANLAAGLQDAFLAHSPVIAITGRQQATHRNRNAYQEIHHWPLFDPVTKFNVYVDTLEDFPVQLRQAFREATTGAPGPAHLELPGIIGEALADCEGDLDVIVEEAFTRVPAFRPEPSAQSVHDAARLLVQAERPVIVAGRGVILSDAGPELVALAEKLTAPVAMSLDGKGCIPDGHPLAVGAAGTYARTCANRVVCDADLVLFVGCQTGDQVTDNWTVPEAGTRVIQIDVDPVELGRNYPTNHAIVGDAKVSLQRLVDVLDSPSPNPEWKDRFQQHVCDWRAEFESIRESDAVPIRPERLCRELTELLPDDAILVSDTGYSASWSGNLIDLKQPTQSYFRCAGSLGWGLPAAMGAKCAWPDRPVICFTGDGGFWYHFGELETAVRCGIPTVTVVNNNRSLNQEKPGVDAVYRDFPQGKSNEIWTYSDVDFAQVARALGCFGIRVEKPAEIRNALEQALAANQPAVVDVATDIEAMAPWTRRPA